MCRVALYPKSFIRKIEHTTITHLNGCDICVLFIGIINSDMISKQFRAVPDMEEELSHRFIARLIGLLLAFESIMLLACCCVSMIYGESDLAAFIISFAVCLVTGVILLLCGQKKRLRHHAMKRI